MLVATPAYTWQQTASVDNSKREAVHPSFDQVMPQPGVSILYPPSYIITTSTITSSNWNPTSSPLPTLSSNSGTQVTTTTTFVNNQTIPSVPATTGYMQSTVKTEPEAAGQTTALPFVSTMKDVGVTQLAQHPGMFPQGYILQNGHAATAEFVQAQAAAQVQAVAVDGTMPSTSVGYSVAGQTILMMDPNQPITNGAIGTSAVQSLPNGMQAIALPTTTSATVTAGEIATTSSLGADASDPGKAAGHKRLHVSNIPFRFRDPDLRQMFGNEGTAEEPYCKTPITRLKENLDKLTDNHFDPLLRELSP